VARRDQVIALLRAGLIDDGSFDAVVEFADARGDLIVVMGEEIVTL
jgi:hypothetical protein